MLHLLLVLAGLTGVDAQCRWVHDRNWNGCFQPHTHWGRSSIQSCTHSRIGWKYAANQWDVGNIAGSPVVSSTWWRHGCKTPNQSPSFGNKGLYTCQCSGAAQSCSWRQDRNWNGCFQPHTHWSRGSIQSCTSSRNGWAYAANQWDIGNLVGSPISSGTWWHHGCKRPSQSPSFSKKGKWTCTCTNNAVNCAVSGWGGWSGCTRGCGGGTRTRSRSVTRNAAHGGSGCPALTEQQGCNTHPCAINCAVGGWGGWGGCSKGCGSGTKTRSRSVTRNAQHGGTGCPTLTEQTSCNTHACPVHCAVSGWSGWGGCSEPCGNGTQKRTRSITRNQAHGGNGCPTLQESRGCKVKECPVNCVQSAWSGWTGCSKTCGTGSQKRTRSVTTNPAHGGTACGLSEETQNCNTQPCPIDCVVSDWAVWGACSQTCSTGTQTRKRTILTDDENGGKVCPDLEESRDCTGDPCPINCEQTAWTEWGPCDKDCGGGEKKRYRDVLTQPQFNGVECGPPEESANCNEEACPTPSPTLPPTPAPTVVDCVLSTFDEWGECSAECEGGTQTRSRIVLVEPSDSGEACGDLTETQDCNTDPCPTPAPTEAPTKAPTTCESYDWYLWLCETAARDPDDPEKVDKKSCESRGCKAKKGLCKPEALSVNSKGDGMVTKEIKCKKLKEDFGSEDGGEKMCGCFSSCKADWKKKKDGSKVFKGCKGSHKWKVKFE